MSGNTEILRALADAFNARDFDRARELVSDDLEFVDVAMGVTTSGPDGFIDYARSWANAFSDMQLEVLAAVADERHASGELVGRGTHDGTLPTPSGEVPATGRRMEVPFTWFADVEGGKLTSMRDYYNALSIMVQLGLMPEPAAAS
jgi:steroid delta-isomerase-like uncharacterized protein